MITYHKNIKGRLTPIPEYEKGCWVNVVEPNVDETKQIIEQFNLEPDFLRAALDEEESSRIETEDENTLIIVDIPFVEKKGQDITYYTLPLGIIKSPDNVITVSVRENAVISEFAEGMLKGVQPNLKTQFIFYILLRIANRFLQYLKQIDKITNYVEIELRKSMKNKEILQLMEIQKSLVYFSSSLKADENTIVKIMRGRHIKLYDEDEDLLQDVIIEIKQAYEMSETYLNILTGTMDAFASVISNNLNIVMKVLASITLLISIPTVISGIYGMNIGASAIPLDQFWWAPIILSIFLMAFSALILWRNKML